MLKIQTCACFCGLRTGVCEADSTFGVWPAQQDDVLALHLEESEAQPADGHPVAVHAQRLTVRRHQFAHLRLGHALHWCATGAVAPPSRCSNAPFFFRNCPAIK